jgi:hypothetical protein
LEHDLKTPWFGFSSLSRAFVAHQSSQSEKEAVYEEARGEYSVVVFKHADVEDQGDHLERAVKAAEVALTRANAALDAARARRSQ